MKSRAPETKTQITPFKTIFNNLILSSRSVDSISVGVEKPLQGLSYDNIEDESDDLYLTYVNFVKEGRDGEGEGEEREKVNGEGEGDRSYLRSSMESRERRFREWISK